MTEDDSGASPPSSAAQTRAPEAQRSPTGALPGLTGLLVEIVRDGKTAGPRFQLATFIVGTVTLVFFIVVSGLSTYLISSLNVSNPDGLVVVKQIALGGFVIIIVLLIILIVVAAKLLGAGNRPQEVII